MSNVTENMNKMSEHTHEMPANTSSGGDHGKSAPNAGTGQRSKNHGYGYPVTIDSIDHSMPEQGVKPSRNSNAHGHSYPGRPYSSEGGAKNASPKPGRVNASTVGNLKSAKPAKGPIKNASPKPSKVNKSTN